MTARVMRGKGMFIRKISILIMVLLFGGVVSAQIVVNSPEELLPYLDDDDVEIKLAPGTYEISGADYTAGTYGNPFFLFEGNNSTYDFTDVTINFSTDILTTINDDVTQIQILGNNNVLKNLTMVDDGEDVKPLNGGVNIIMDGSENRIEGFHMSVKGSYPYGYGDAFGKGGDVVIKHFKHSGALIRGTSNHFKDVTMISRSYGHCVFMQGAVDPIIEGCYIEGEMRSTDDMLAETSGPAYDVGFNTIWGYKLPAGFMMSLQEAGIRAYTSGITTIDGEVLDRRTSDPIVLNCIIKNVRAGVTLTHASGTEYVEGTTCLGSERGFAIGNGSIVDCSSDVIYGPALALDGTSSTSTTADLTILSSDEEYYNGSGQAISLTGNGYDITIRGDGSFPDQDLGIEISGIYKDIRNYEVTALTPTSDVKIHNLSAIPLILGERSSGTTGESGGMITDLGTDNSVVSSAISVLNIEAEDHTDMSGVATVETSDDGGGSNISSIDTDDWMEYELTVPATGTYSFDYRVSGTASGNFEVDLDGTTIDEVTFEATGDDQVWSTVRSTTPVYLSEGVNTILVTSNSTGWNLNWLQLLPECIDSPIVPFIYTINALGTEENIYQRNGAIVFPSINVTLDPAPKGGGSWDWSGPDSFSSDERELVFTDVQLGDGGDFVATFTNDCGQQSEETFSITVTDVLLLEAESYVDMDGVLTESTTDTDGGENVTDINSGDWIELEVDIPFTADFSIDYRVASETANGSFTVSSNGTDIADVSFDATGGPQVWTTVNSESLTKLEAGNHVIRITSSSDGWNLNWVSLNLDQLVSNCELPYNTEDIVVSNETIDWSSGILDISCVSSVNIYAGIEGIGTMEDADYLNIYYKLDGGDPVHVMEITEGDSETILRVNELSGRNIELIIQGVTSSSEKQFEVSDIVILHGSETLLDVIEAETFDDMSGVEIEESNDTGGGQHIGFIENGSWCMFEDVDLTGLTRLEARLSTSTAGGDIEVRVGGVSGELLGTVTVTSTGSWNIWDNFSGELSGGDGIGDIYFVFTGTSSFLFNINWFQFSVDRDVKQSQEIRFSGVIEKTIGDEDYTPFAFLSSGLPVIYSSSNPEVAIIVDGKVSIVGVGVTTITATSEESTLYEQVESTQELIVNELPPLSTINTIEGVQVYPNPTNSVLNVRIGGNQYSQLEVYDITGTRILNRSIGNSESLFSLNLEGLSKGVYVMVLKGVQKNDVQRIVKH